MPAQRQFTLAEYLGWTDNYSRAIAAILAATGDEDSAGTAAYHAAAVRNAINAFTDPDTAEITIDLLPAAADTVAKITTPTFLQVALSGFNSAILSALGADLNAWLTAQGGRVHYLFRQIGNPYIQAVNAFPPVTVLGSMAVTGSGAGTFTDGIPVNSSLYGGAQVQFEVTGNPIGAADITATAHVVTAGGSSTTLTALIPNGSSVGTKVDLGEGTDRVVDCTAVTFTGGTDGDAFRVQTKMDRDLDGE